MRPGFSFKTSKLSGADKIKYLRIPQLSWYLKKKKKTKTITGRSRFIEGQNAISAKIMHKNKTQFSYQQENPRK